MSGMKILGFHAENFKKLRVVDFTPPEDTVELTGGNEQGKTSVMDGVQLTLCGLKSRDDIPEPIRRGEDRAVVQVTLGESADKVQLVARRVWRKSGTFDFVLENAEGAAYKSPQQLMDKVVGAIALDPGKFGQMDDKKQLETLLKLVDIPLDLAAHAKARQAKYDARTAVNKDITDLGGQLKLMAAVPEGTPDEEVSTATVLEEQTAAQNIMQEHEKKRQYAQNYKNELAADAEKLIALTEKCKELRRQLDEAEADASSLEGSLKSRADTYEGIMNGVELLEDPDMTVFTAKISGVEEMNRLVRIKKKHAELQAAFKVKSEQSAGLTAEIDALDKKKSDALAAAKMPIAGLSFDENGVRYNGTPFCQCSSEERLRVSCAMAAAMNPKLKVIFARDASLLDGKHRDILKAFAKDNGYQLWMELADDSGKFGIVFEDGSIVPTK